MKCRNFRIEELVDPKTFEELGEEACWMLFNEEALLALDDLRTFIGKRIIVNDWHSGGSFQFRGYRPIWCTIGAPHSEHRMGEAFDCTVGDLSADAARALIIANKDNELLKRIMRLETGISWVHFDIKSVVDRIHLFTA